jgi:hypothetical protein
MANNGQAVSLLGLQEQIKALRVGGSNDPALAAIEEQLATLAKGKNGETAKPAAPKMAKPKVARKPKAEPAAPAPVVGVAPNGAKLDASDPYKRMVAFAHKALITLRKAEDIAKGYKGLYSGRMDQRFPLAIGGYMGILPAEIGSMDSDTRHGLMAKVYQLLDAMVERGDLQRRPCKGGYMLYIPGEMKASNPTARYNPADLVAQILGTK